MVLLLSSCSYLTNLTILMKQRFKAKDVLKYQNLQSAELLNVQKPQVKPVVAVYPSSFTDQTGQRKSNSEFALFSTAITQQPSSLLLEH